MFETIVLIETRKALALESSNEFVAMESLLFSIVEPLKNIEYI